MTLANECRGLRVLGLRTLTTFPSSAFEGHSVVAGADFGRGGDPYEASDRPRPSFVRRPAKDDAIRKIRMPSTASFGVLRGSLLQPLPKRPLAHAVHDPALGTVCSDLASAR
jgi:hypothetical protein